MLYLKFLVAGLVVAGIFGICRLISGPTQLDRVLAIDYLSIVGLAGIILLAVITKEPKILDVGICLALVGFLTAFITSKYYYKGGQ